MNNVVEKLSGALFIMILGRMNRAIRFTPNFFKQKIRGARFYPLRIDSVHIYIRL